MKKITLSLILLALIFVSFSSSYSQDKKEGTVLKGVVVDKTSGTAMESATIQVFKSEDSTLYNGASTDKSGSFIINGIPEGLYTVKVSYIGYSTAVAKNVKAGKDRKEINLGTVQLEVNSEMTQEINVVDEAPTMTFENGKKIYDVKKDLTAQNGNVLDMLKNVPSVNVDNDGNVSLRGSGNVKILIDGKPSALLSNGTQVLQNIPANMIEKVEIINNPSAKYEAEGISGIINLVMKQGQNNNGYNGNVKVNGGTEDKYNFGTGGSVRKGKFSFNANYSYWNYFLPGHSIINRSNFSSIETRTVSQDLNWKYKGISHYGSFGLDYDIDKLNTLSLVGNIFYYKRSILAKNYLNFFDASGNNTGFFRSDNNDGRNGNNLDLTLTYTKKFEQKEKEFSTFVNYSRRREDSPIEYTNFDNSSTAYLTKKDSYYTFNFINSQADYIHPFNENSKLETGLKSNLRLIKGELSYIYLDNNTNQWLPIAGKDNDADYKDAISAAYLTYSNKYKDFSYSAGLRGEHSYLDFSILLGKEKYDQNYFDLFPSLSMTQKLGNENQFQLTYSRRINRPNLFLLNPFTEQFDEFTKRSGNPYLKPEYIHSTELGYTRYLPIGSVTLSGYYRNTNNVINFVSNVDTNGVTSSRPENRGKSNTFGLELILQGGFAKWWTYNGSLDYFSTNIFDNSSSYSFDKTYNAWSARFSTNASIPDLFDVQLFYFYMGKQVNSQGEIRPMQMMNIAIQKAFFEKKLVLGFRVNDLFNQQRFYLNTSGSDFSQVISQKTNSRAAFFTVTFNFGEQSNTTSKRTSQRKQREIESEIQQTGN
ncbi:MAG: TonB-dependent receptor [Ignavibacteriae bacterium]|nr:TonB-dependent receptor [Ignavibacteriota bacterium]